MAKVSLRIYNREIERLVEQGHIDEAIAHCRHILKTFPKHLETYRMLGKAFLEAKRYGEAVDVFGRVLMAAPGDFVSHVGLSIISDEENKLDDAIWHMERAFEAQPSNAAIQGELQRLYGRRDGMEPPKIRMTRGALAHMYVQGELYPQAIAEIRAVLAEDSQRSDMQTLLAFSYFKGGQKSDASDICNQLLKRYPYCFDANRIMVELLPATAGSTESTQVYRMRVGELDPYANFARGSVFQTSDVPDASINLERLEYSGEDAAPAGQEWTSSLGIELGSASVPALGASSFDDQPDWLKSGGASTEAPQSAPTAGSASESNDQIPDFLRAAGWGESNTPEKPTSIFDEDEAPASGEGLVPADLPDWLKGQVPTTDSQTPPTQPRSDMLSATDTPDWLSGLDNTASASETSSAPQANAAPASDLPDWLSGLGAAAATTAAATAASQPEPVLPSSDVPDWLSGLGESEKPAEPASTPDWLSGTNEQAAEAQPADLPDWLRAAEPKSEPSASVENLGASAQEQDDAVAWLESLAAKHGAKPEELVTDPNKRSETPPEWVSQAQTINQQPAAQQPTVESLGSSAQEQDDAVAWLESLAAKHGAKPEELVTDPNKRSETPPEWVSQAQTINQQPEQPQPTLESLGSSAQEQDDAVAWLESLAAKHGAKPEELVTDPNKRSETPPEWVSQAQSIGETQSTEKQEWSEGAQNIGEQFFSEFENASKAEPAADETGMWLRDLDDKEKQEDQPLERGNIPEWLSDVQRPSDAGNKFEYSEEKEAAPSSDLPNWLSGIDDGAPVESGDYVSQNLSNQDLSDWLSGLDNEPGLDIDPEIIRASARPPLPNRPDAKPVEPQPAKTDLPDWLSGVDAASSESEDDSWKESIEPVASTPTEAPAPVALTADLPDWLKGVDETEQQEGEDAPPWLHREQYEAEAPQQLKPTSPSDWHPVAPKPEVDAQQPKQTVVTQTAPPSAQAKAQPILKNPPSPEPSEQPRVEKKKPAKAARPKAEGLTNVNVLVQAKGELDRGDIPTALDHYGKLIKKGKHLEETIRDLTESIYRYPVEVGIWQTLGDAYMRANRLKEALEAYNKAEELIR